MTTVEATIKNPLLRAALDYAEKGIATIPLKPKSKVPLFTEWPTKANSRPESVKSRWTKNPEANIGIPTGAQAGIIVLDIDRNHKEGVDGLNSLCHLLDEFGVKLPETPFVETGGGGRQYFFKHPGGLVKSRMGLRPGVDLIADGTRFVVAPPSIHPRTGEEYRWKEGYSLDDLPMISLPPWLMFTDKDSPKLLDFYRSGQAIMGSHNQTLFEFGTTMWGHGIEPDELAAFLLALDNTYCIPRLGQSEVGQITQNIVRHGIKRNASNDAYASTVERMLKEHRIVTTDKGLAFYYTGSVWKRLEDTVIQNRAMQYGFYNDKIPKACLDLVKAMTVKPDLEWNQLKQTEIAFKNGVLDFETGILQPHEPEDYLETIIPHNYSPAATCPIWLACLETFFGDDQDGEEKKAALQEFFGYALMPQAMYKKALLCIGRANTGKTVTQNVMTEMVGDKNTCQLPIENMGSPRKRACIVGKLLNAIGELSHHAKLHDAGFKQLVSIGEMILIDEKYMPQIHYRPIAKHAIFTNHMPEVNDSSGAVYERFLIVEFNNPLPKEEQDKHLLDKLKLEIEGIIAWAVEGASRLKANGGEFTIPASSRERVEQLKDLADPIKLFMDDCMYEDETAKTPTMDIMKAYHAWGGSRTTTTVALNRRLKQSGYTIKKGWVPSRRANYTYLEGYAFKSHAVVPVNQFTPDGNLSPAE